jgi:putative ABC transport system ATP-binding protein
MKPSAQTKAQTNFINPPALELKNVSFTLPSGRRLLENINAEIFPGEFVILMGSNGSGKSTLMKVIHRDYYCKEGVIFLNGKNTAKIQRNRFLKEVIRLTQYVGESLFFDLTLFENAKLLTKIASVAELEKHLEDFNPNLLKAIHRPVSELSGGEQQQVAFALYLTHKPSLLLLDEHTSALDPKAAEKMIQMTQSYIKKHQITCLMTTHNLSFSERFGDKHWVMESGKILTGE